MIELEIQALSQQREGLLIEVGRLIVASGFVLQRQRLAQDPHGTLLTMVVRGQARRQRALEAALSGHERIISFEIAPFVEGEARPHFAASRKNPSGYVPPPVAPPEPEPAAPAKTPIEKRAPATPRNFDEINRIELSAAAPSNTTELEPERAPPPAPTPAPDPEPEFEFLPGPPARAPTPPPSVEVQPFVEVIQLGPDIAAVAKLLRELDDAYPHILPHVLTLDRGVEEGAREASLSLAGKRVGSWVFQRDHATATSLGLHEAIERVGVPALGALVEVEQQGGQLHIRNSPLCAEDGHSGCKFFSGYLEGLLAPATGSRGLSIFAVGCRSWGAGECVLAVGDSE